MVTLFKAMFIYAGRWSVDDTKLVTKVDSAWDPGSVETEQVQYHVSDGQTLSLRTAPIDTPTFPGQKLIGYVNWQREA